MSNVIRIAAGYSHSAALRADGTVIVWGSQPNPSSELGEVIEIAAGSAYTLALRRDGTVVAWGGMTQVPEGLKNVISTAAGNGQNLALKSNGEIVSWTEQGTQTIKLDHAIAIACGSNHQLALIEQAGTLKLTSQVLDNNLVLTWPVTPEGFSLESKSDIDAEWQPTPGPYDTKLGNNIVSERLNFGSRFYRLKKD
jgi:hypothetical protein